MEGYYLSRSLANINEDLNRVERRLIVSENRQKLILEYLKGDGDSEYARNLEKFIATQDAEYLKELKERMDRYENPGRFFDEQRCCIEREYDK